MFTSRSSREAVAPRGGAKAVSMGEALRLLSAGAPGEILLTLFRGGPSQTKVLTHSVKGYTARTTYRYLSKLGEIGVLDRDDDPEGSARVVHTLSAPAGEELAELIDRFAAASMTRLPGGQIDSREWTSLGLLADLWEAGVIDALSHGPTSPAELTRRRCRLSYHQLNRRASRFKASGFFCEAPQSRRQRRVYALTPKARRTMGLIVGIGRWRRRHYEGGSDAGLTPAEMTTALRALLPLAVVTPALDEGIRFCVEDRDAPAELWAGNEAKSSASARGTVSDWMGVLLDGEPRVETAGDSARVHELLARLYEELWAPPSAARERG
jgi:DNA-binding HxlR family transcriptional regulator